MWDHDETHSLDASLEIKFLKKLLLPNIFYLTLSFDILSEDVLLFRRWFQLIFRKFGTADFSDKLHHKSVYLVPKNTL